MPILIATADVSIWSWTFNPVVIFSVYIASFFYYRAVGPRRERWFPGSPPVETWRIACFAIAMLSVVIALLSPLEKLSDDYLLTAHMVQHLLLTIVIPPLMLVGIPPWMYQLLRRDEKVWQVWRFLTKPILAFILFQVPFALAHTPIFYDLTLQYQVIHVAEHMVFLGTSFLVWWPILAPNEEYGKLPPVLQMFFLFASTLPGQIVGALITMAGEPVYHTYAVAPRVWGLSATADQQIGGLIMWVGTGTFYLAALSVVFFLWANREDANESKRYQTAAPRPAPSDPS
jgi:putative membrane protein